jgi:hypothetical protein
MKRLFIPLLACLSFADANGAPAVPAAPVPSPDGERFLFIVDTSGGMEKLKDQNETAIYELLRGGLFGQMQAGDTFGLWTFNKETDAGKFPMQVWEPRRATQLGAIVAAYLSGLHYENSDDVKRMIDLLLTVVRAVSNVNVFILSDGSSSLRGIPFEKAINAEYRKQRRDRSSAKQPFVTTLIARDGSITNYSVVVAGQPILLPKRPASVVAAAAKAAASANHPAGVLLSITGTMASATIAQPPSPAPPTPAQLSTASPPPSNAAAKPEVSSRRLMHIVTKSNNVPAAVEPATPEPAKPDDSLGADSTTNRVAAIPSAPPPAPPAPTAVAEALPAESPAPGPALASLLAEPLVVAARELPAEPATPGAVPPVVQAAALPAPQGPGAGFFLTFGSLLMAAACFLLFVVFRRLRPAPGASLITQSMERR